MSGDELFDRTQYCIPPQEKDELLLARLNTLVAHHREHCPAYARILRATAATAQASCLAEVPWLPVGLFKSHDLRSVADEEVFKVLTSSGTTSAAKSRVALDRPTATAQARALSAIMQTLLGKRRRPMLIIDHRGIIEDRANLSARGAGILGLMTLGRDHTFALDQNMHLRREAVMEFCRKHQGEPTLIFGFTFMVWQYFAAAEASTSDDMRLPGATLIHSGGWKKLKDRAVDATTFAETLGQRFGIAEVRSFYGMAEQVGSVFMEGESGFLHPPNFAEVIIRDPNSWRPVADGNPGVVQVLSCLPRSYPGHSILTEDLGTVHGRRQSPCGRLGTYFTIHGRLPQVEIRGCSDTQGPRSAAEAP